MVEMSMKVMFCVNDSLDDELLRRGYQNYYANIDTENRNSDSYLSALPSEIINQIKNYMKRSIQKYGRDTATLLLRRGWKKPKDAKEVKQVFTYDTLSWEVGDEAFLSMELFFQPDLFNIEMMSIQESIMNTIHSYLDPAIRETLYQNILLVGGISTTKNFPERLQCELMKLNNGREPGLVAPEGREYAAWRGASMMSQTDILTKEKLK